MDALLEDIYGWEATSQKQTSWWSPVPDYLRARLRFYNASLAQAANPPVSKGFIACHCHSSQPIVLFRHQLFLFLRFVVLLLGRRVPGKNGEVEPTP